MTCNGYYRSGSKLDLYHFALIDLLGSAQARRPRPADEPVGGRERQAEPAAAPHGELQPRRYRDAQRPGRRVPRIARSIRRRAGHTVVQNEAYLRRLATNAARAGVSAGLGSSSGSRSRPRSRTACARVHAAAARTNDAGDIDAAAERRGLGQHRRSPLDQGCADRHRRVALVRRRQRAVPAQRGPLPARLVGREIKNGRGEWQGEVAYLEAPSTRTKYVDLHGRRHDCYGSSKTTLSSSAGELSTGSLRTGSPSACCRSRADNTSAATAADPAITGTHRLSAHRVPVLRGWSA